MRDAQEADTQAVWKTLLSGACAGVASKSVVAPIERLKVIVQTAGELLSRLRLAAALFFEWLA